MCDDLKFSISNYQGVSALTRILGLEKTAIRKIRVSGAVGDRDPLLT